MTQSNSIDTPHHGPGSKPRSKHWQMIEGSKAELLMAAGFGALFGFLLQKGGVANFDILIGVLLLQNFVVIKVMLSAIVVGMVVFHLLERRGLTEHKIKATRYGGNAFGGLVFGAGFALLAYCPGTDAAAVGQGNYDALVGIVGMVLGSCVYALSYQRGVKRLAESGKRGELTLPTLMGMGRGTFIAIAVPILLALLGGLEWLEANQ